MRTPHLLRRLGLAALSLALVPSLCLAQDGFPQIPSASAEGSTGQDRGEVVNLTVGDIFDVLPVTTAPTPSYAWILLQDGTFIQANRSGTFHYRFILQGTYTLTADLSSPGQPARPRKTMTIVVAPRQTAPNDEPATASGNALVRTYPPADESNRVILPTGSTLMRLEPIDPSRKPLALDLDIATDANGDGVPSNDIQSTDTFFQTDTSTDTPLHLWFFEEPTMRTMRAAAIAAGAAVVQDITVIPYEMARQMGVIKPNATIVATPTGERTYEFSVRFDDPNLSTAPLLYQWRFGDGEESLAGNPTHTYSVDGTYEVQLNITNLQTSQPLTANNTTVQVSAGGQVSSAGSAMSEDGAASAASSASSEASGGSSSGGLLWTIVLLVGIFVGSLIVGALVIMLLSRLLKRGKRIDEPVGGPASGSPSQIVSSPTPALSLSSTPPAAVAKKEEEKSAPARPAPAQVVDKADAPAWLKKGMNDAPATPAPAPAPAPKPAPVPPPPAPKPAPVPPPPAPKPATPPTPPAAPAPAPKAATPAPSDDLPLPSWLQPQGQKPAAPTPAPAPAPAPAAPKPVPPPPAPKPVPAPPAPKPAPSAPAAPATPAPAPKAPTEPKPVPPPPAPKPAPVPPPPAAKPATPPPAPTPAAPKPVPPPPPKPAPSAPPPTAKPATPAPAAPAAPTPPSTPPTAQAPANPAPAQNPPAAPASDEPIATIRVDSLQPPVRTDDNRPNGQPLQTPPSSPAA